VLQPGEGLEYLFHEVTVIESQLLRLNLGLDDHMRQALVSFIHSVGWESFLYSRIIDCLEVEDFSGATEEIGRWIFDQDHKVIGGLLDRRREEMNLFLQEVDANPWASTEILLTAFRNYTAAPMRYVPSVPWKKASVLISFPNLPTTFALMRIPGRILKQMA
jgi:hypothetical protein